MSEHAGGPGQGHDLAYAEPEKIKSIDAEFLAGHRFPYQEDISLVEHVDLDAATPGQDINWLEDIALLEEDGVPAVFDRYSNSFLKIYFPIPPGARGRDRTQGADHALDVRELVRDRAEGEAHEVPPAGARPVGRRARGPSVPTTRRPFSKAGRSRQGTSS